MLFKNRNHILTLALLLFSVGANAAGVTLQSQSNQISIDPQSFSIKWNDSIVNTSALKVNDLPQKVTKNQSKSANSASWTLQPSRIHVKAQLKNDALIVNFIAPSHPTIERNSPLILKWFDLAESQSNTLFLPFSEGMRIPIQDKVWARYLVDNYSGANTTQELKMPFWTVQQKDTYISYQLVEATNNQLDFSSTKNRIDMTATHSFTALNQSRSFTLRITLGDNWLDGAKSYRQWRIDHDLADPLVQKIQRNANVEKLIGASQVYLFGIHPLSTLDVTDWWGLRDWYFQRSTLNVTSEAQSELSTLSKNKDWFSQYHKQLLIDSISTSLRNKFNVPNPTLADNTIAAQYNAAQQRVDWLKSNASEFLTPPNTWGQALSANMLNNLKKAGLEKLWLGFDNWMPAFYQPNVIDAAKRLGYLVATYDSYNTAIPSGVNDGWLTARLPEPMRKACAIELADGRKKKGFRGNGYYLNPNCHLNYVKQRVLDIVKYGHFNSLFIDVDATAMAREDYSNNSSESDMLTAFNKRMDWISNQDQIVLGSEDGNSLTTSGIAFAHGLESVGFGWMDNDMKKNRQSPYFLGRWYPDHKPEFFFKSAKVKEPYKSLLFAPQFRIPLYQTVFHDEVVNSHHWHSDSLKFTDVKAYRDLTAMLYNTPAMVHLTRDEAVSSLSPRIVALKHYQDGFKPIHEHLWDNKLIGFTWLNKSGTVQQTTFDDGSTIIANFSSDIFGDKDTRVRPFSIRAELSSGKVVLWQSKSL